MKGKLQDSLSRVQNEKTRIKIGSRISEINDRLEIIGVIPPKPSEKSIMDMDKSSLRDLKRHLFYSNPKCSSLSSGP